MANGYAKEIQNRIGAAPDGTIFIVSDFADVADSETIRRNLNRLVQAGTLRRILKGVFEKPKYSKLLAEYVAADPDAVAKALAMLSLDHRSLWRYRIKYAGAVYPGNGSMVLYQRWAI